MTTDNIEIKTKNNFLKDYIKYCLAYLRIQNATIRPKDFISLDSEFFNLQNVLETDPEGESVQTIELPILNKYAPESVPKDEEEQYQKEKKIGKSLENLISVQKNEEFTKEIILRFGKFDFRASTELSQQRSLRTSRQSSNTESESEEVSYTHYLFYIRATIDNSNNKYKVNLLDGRVFYDLGIFESIFENDDTYYDILKEFGESERDDKLNLPTPLEALNSLCTTLLSKLRLTNITFSQEKVDFSEITFSVAPKANYFLTQDLEKLVQDEKDDILDTSLVTWDAEADDDLNVIDEAITKNGNLFFPFAYNRSQLQTLKLLQNKTFVIEGPPGTGKSQTITNLLCQLAAQGKTVLFVSQKQQALKVVKDRLSSLNIENLFGYISSDKNEKQDYDTFSNSLERLKAFDSHAQREVDPRNIPLALQSINEKAVLFNEGIKQQGEVFELSEKLKEFPDSYPYLENNEILTGSFDLVGIKRYQDYIDLRDNSSVKVEEYKKNLSEDVKRYNMLFATVIDDVWERNLSKEIQKMINGMKQYDFENKSFFKSVVIKNKLKKAHQDNIQHLPREISAILVDIKSSDKSLGMKVKDFESVQQYCLYKENELQAQKALVDSEQLIIECNITMDIAQQIATIVLTSASPYKELESLVEFNRIQSELRSMELINYPEMAKEVISYEERRQQLAKGYLKNLMAKRAATYNNLAATIRGKIVSFAKGIRKTKKAFKTFERLRNDLSMFEGVAGIVPIWIMSLEDASRILPLEGALFDYLILDEASQCNIAYALPAMYRASKSIIVGDVKQMRDDTMLFKKKSLLEDIATRHGIDEDRRIIGRFDNVKSILDIGLQRGFRSQLLEEHYRSPSELIGFSNENFYSGQLKVVNHNYLTYKDTNRVLINHKVEYIDDPDDISPSVNVSEVNKIIELIKDFKSDPLYKDESIAVLTFFNDQANLVRKKIEESFGPNHGIKISIIEGIQGDERDIAIYSFVIRDNSQKRQYVALTGEGGEIRPELTAGRVNVAFSRARKQVHCVSCLDRKDWPTGIWIDKYLKYVEDNGEVESSKLELRPFESFFEEDFYNLASNAFKDYLIYNQVPSCGYRLDFVIQNKKNGKKVIVECDGPQIGHHFKDEASMEYTDTDIKRQLVLESAGWKFVRIKYSDWINKDYDRKTSLEEIRAILS